MAIANAQLISTDKTEVFVSTGENAITCLIFCNTSVTDEEVTVWVVPASQPAGDANMIVNAMPITAGETFSIDTERFILSEGDSVQAQSIQNNLITATVSYVATGQ
tara:strand:+ start:476 stop:793 length:318 start_codon:yes stop_codon:yes gene_type:complete